MTLGSVSEFIQALLASKRLGHQVAAHQYVPGHTSHPVVRDEVVPTALKPILASLGIDALYGHQVEAIKAIGNGKHTVVTTSTASGKSLIYNMALFKCLLNNPHARGLYLFPLKALTQDQHKSFEQWSHAAPWLQATAAVYDGDTSAYRRKKIRSAPPHVILTNPEMVHLALLPYHRQWGEFFQNIKLVVLDEVHTYRGLLGSHMAQVLGRLKRICALYGSEPTFVFTSATMANPGELTQQLCGAKVTTVQGDETTKGGRHLVLMDGAGGPAQTGTMLLKAALSRNLRSIVYTQSRKLAELITLRIQQSSHQWADKISVYRSGLLAQERRIIEQRLQSGELLAVVSTSALELGIDIGDLDVCILVGYPGSMISTWQRSGRVGRKGQEAALLMVAGQDALDQYFVAQPEAFFNGRTENAVINPFNPIVQEAHLVCAADELALHRQEKWLQEEKTAQRVKRLERIGALLRTVDGDALHARQRRPHRKVDLRGAGRRFSIIVGDRVIGELNDFSLYREAHPGAVYLHQGMTYLAGKIDMDANRVTMQPAKVAYHTRVRSDTDVEILNIYESKYIDKTVICAGNVKVIEQVNGYEKVHTANGRKLGQVPLAVPPVEFITDAVWFEIPLNLCHLVTHSGFDLLGALHAAEHATISIMPLLVLADRNDIGGVATPYNSQNQMATIFIYDGVPGGAGFSRLAYAQALKLLRTAAKAIEQCKCPGGCPACVHSPKCGSGNQPMDKAGALYLLKRLTRPGKVVRKTEPATPAELIEEPNASPLQGIHYGVFDLETQRSAKEVGGWHMAHRMKVSCGVVYDSRDDSYRAYRDNQVEELINHLKQLELVVGFNTKRFDYQVLSRYSDYDFSQLPNFDILERVHNQMGFRLSLDHLAKETIMAQKSGSGLDALVWWQQGQIDKIIAYCRKDVKITRDLYCYARDKGYLIYRNKEGERFRIPLRMEL